MKAHINEDEFRLLAYLHENAKGYTLEFMLAPQNIAKSLNVDLEQLKKDASYLAGHGLVETKSIDYSTMNTQSFQLTGIWLTSTGEDYLRDLEQAPGVARKLTTSVVKELWQLGKGPLATAAVQLLTEFAKTHHLP